MDPHSVNNARQRADELIDALGDDRLPADLRARVGRWLVDAPDRGVIETTFADWVARRIDPHAGTPGRAARRGWRRLSTALGFDVRELPSEAFTLRRLSRVAVGVAAAVALSLLAVKVVPHRVSSKTSMQAMVCMSASENLRTITLPDGSTVRLAAGSTLTYPLDFTRRDVTLNGEAFFSVVQAHGHPFLVRVDNMGVRVLGTQFWVRSVGDHSEAEVILLHGKVSVLAGMNHQTMHPGDKVVVDAHHGRIIGRTQATPGERMRVSGSEFGLQRVPVSEALRAAADYFELPFSAPTDIPPGESISLIPRKNMPLEEVLDSINHLSEQVSGRVENGVLMADVKLEK